MKRLAIAAAVVLSVPVVLIVVLLTLLANPESFREEISTGFKAATGFDLQTGGVTWRYFPPVSLRLVDVSIRSGDGHLADLDEASVDVAVLPLIFSGTLDLQGVTVEGLRLNLLMHADGTNNWTPTPGPEAAETEAVSDATTDQASADAVPAGAPDSLRVQNVSLRNVDITLVDEAADSRLVITLKEFLTRDIAYDQPFDVSWSGEVTDEGAGLQLATSGETTVKVTSQAAEIEVQRLRVDNEVSLPDMPAFTTSLNLSGTLDRAADTFTLKQFDVSLPGGTIAGDAHITNLSADPAINGNLQIRLNAKEAIIATGSTPPVTANPDALSNIVLQGAFVATTSSVTIDPLTGNLDATPFNGSASMNLSGTHPSVVYNLAFGNLALHDYLEPEAGATASGDTAETTSPPQADSEIIPVDTLASIDVDGNLTIEAVTLDSLSMDQLSLGLILKAGKLTSTFRASAYGGTIDSQIRVDARQTPVTSIESHATNVDLHAMTGFEWITGTLKFDSTLSTNGAMLSEILASIDGISRFELQDGTLDVQPVKAAAETIDSLRGTTSGVSNWPDVVSFTSLDGSHEFHDGALAGQKLAFALETLRGTGEGGFDLLGNTMEYNLQMVFINNPDSPLQVDESMTDIRWPLRCSGALDAPPADTCRPDGAGLRRLVADIAKKEITGKARDKLLDKLPADMQDKAKGALKGLFR